MVSEWERVGRADADDGNSALVHRHKEAGTVSITLLPGGPERSLYIPAALVGPLAELLGRTAMPGQPGPCAYCEDDPDHPDPDNPGTCTCQAGGCGQGHCPKRDAAAELGLTVAAVDPGLMEQIGQLADAAIQAPPRQDVLGVLTDYRGRQGHIGVDHAAVVVNGLELPLDEARKAHQLIGQAIASREAWTAANPEDGDDDE